MKEQYPFEIVILGNKTDFYLTKILVASIRYYYPNIKINLIKDELNGKFNTRILEKYFKVSLLDLGLKKYGWCTGKISLILASQLKNKKYLLLDSDIVFVGNVLEKIIPLAKSSDFVVSPEIIEDLNSNWFKNTYFDFDWALSIYPDYVFPGFSFNCGQMIVTAGLFKPEELLSFISLEIYPYWTAQSEKHLPCRDQSLLNILLPLKNKRKEITLSKIEFQLWSDSERTRNLNLEVIKGKGYPFLIHWAGALRVPELNKMTRSDVLIFFQKEYLKKIPFGMVIGRIDKIKVLLNNISNRLKNKLKKSLKFF
jgi:lipopolysaccharide biosynthesis glycosyltransferase